MNHLLPRLALLFCLLISTVRLAADRVELADGSVVLGRLVSVDGGKLKLETSFAGTITIDQAKVKAMATDEAVNVSLADGTTSLRRINDPAVGPAPAVAEVASLWRQGAESPSARLSREIAEKARRKWSYEASVAINGRTGAREKFSGSAGIKATLGSSRDRLILSLAMERAQDRGVATSDREFGGVDYSSFYSKDHGWYVRTSLEQDKIKSIDLRSSSAFGFSRKLVRKGPVDLQGRLGASYLLESYSNGTDFDSPGLDLTLLNVWSLPKAKLSSTVTYTPAFKNFSNYRLKHESGLELPLTASLWKLKLGLNNEYQSRPPGVVEKLDTTYMTSLILNWK